MRRTTICTDCGGIATVSGTPDDSQIICNQCDPRGPVIKEVYRHRPPNGGTKEMITVHLEDHGQDFLEWDIVNGVVVDCRPCQAWLWNGTRVHNTKIQPGDVLDITSRNDQRTTLNYRVERVVRTRRDC